MGCHSSNNSIRLDGFNASIDDQTKEENGNKQGERMHPQQHCNNYLFEEVRSITFNDSSKKKSKTDSESKQCGVNLKISHMNESPRDLAKLH